MTFDQGTIEKLRGILQPKRKRYDFAFTMNRWAEIVRQKDRVRARLLDETDDDFFRPIEEDEYVVVENEDEHVAHLLGLPRGTQIKEDESSPPLPKKGRRRVDPERWAALLLAVVFSEYTKAKPTRIGRNPVKVTSTFERDKTSPFYQFATAACEAIGFYPSEKALREATEAWDRSRRFSKRKLHLLLWGQLPSDDSEGPNLTWPERNLPRRKNSPPGDRG
jgi:hypothetical protein